ncbi:MAG: hypothetical protein Q7S40_12730 [Opitutaceae bacterium]|nr:hypothetical protein [Opitutaceae bacterium]
MTEAEYRVIERRLDQALADFDEQWFSLPTGERKICESLLSARKEVHEMRIQEEATAAPH